jgi:hypothetical protein
VREVHDLAEILDAEKPWNEEDVLDLGQRFTMPFEMGLGKISPRASCARVRCLA